VVTLVSEERKDKLGEGSCKAHEVGVTLADRFPVMFLPIVALVILASTAVLFPVMFTSCAKTEVNTPEPIRAVQKHNRK
jgi:Na+/H+ antiporter NhaC